ncbi:MAG: nucleoside triphosphate pyrophosphohydrolase [Myxococcota bacterium]|jgi:tetrapyrrole methylase family protein/MazG family protein/ATP diphosphatase|nr:nucleoside triphosphate pyrophosphohydrolase [Myxococcota bacterium]
MNDDGASLARLVDVMRALLGPEGCPWDKEQTLETLRPYVVEEAHEVVEAIDGGEPEPLREELGDLLFQVVFLSELAAQKRWFGIDDVVRGIAEKMVRRHPWVFGDEKPSGGGAEALARWEAQKSKEKKSAADPADQGKKSRGALGGVPASLPALLRAWRVGEKAAAHGYDWPDSGGVRLKVDEELAELDEAVASGVTERIEHELGDLLFALASYGRKLGVDPEAALRRALDRFSTRFRHAELAAEAAGTELRALDPEALDRLWQEAKRDG